ncbi:MAG: BamA/TamA family outer membrane protein [Deltaproteobacteria bacterium]|nr:BamA/TamA family outer membrane protein [Deltaproteobacteria bacterium]MCB9787271.1 BamA/TamA family outer membrane protein [Deltaproteobacteria bacterium]
MSRSLLTARALGLALLATLASSVAAQTPPGLEPLPAEPTDPYAPAPEPPPVAQATDDDCLFKPITRVAFAPCEAGVCKEAGDRERLLDLAGLQAGRVMGPDGRDRAMARLAQTGFFNEVVFRCEPDPAAEGVSLTVVVRLNRFVRKVHIHGNKAFRLEEIKKRVFLRPGSILEVVPGQEDQSEAIARQIDSLTRLYRREGLEQVRFDVTVTAVDPITLDVDIAIDEGARSRVRELVVEHQQLLTPAPGEPGCPQVSRARIRKLVALRVGGVVTSRNLRNIRRTLETFFQSIGYMRPQVEVRAEGDPLTLTVLVRTERCWLIRVWRRPTAAVAGDEALPAFRLGDPYGLEETSSFEGAPYERASFSEWRQTLPFGESGVFDRDEAVRGAENLRYALQQQGYLFADVSMTHVEVPRADVAGAAVSPVAGTIDYRLTLEGERRIQGILFPGRRSFSEDELLEVISTNVYDTLGDGGFVGVDAVFADLKSLAQFYRERGFYAFRFLSSGEERPRVPRRRKIESKGWLIWEYSLDDRVFRVRKRKSETVVYLEIPFEEGPRTRLSEEPTIIGNKALPTAELEKLLSLHKGDAFGTYQLENGLKRIRRWYEQRGYHQAELTTTCDSEEAPPVGGDCAQVHSRTAELILVVEERRRSVVGQIFWRGNFKTRPSVLVRDLPKPGEPYSQARIVEASKRLRNLGVFTSVKIERIGAQETPAPEQISLVVAVEEAESRFVDLAAGFRTIDREADRNSRAPPIIGSLVAQGTAGGDRSTSGLARVFALALPDILLNFEAEYIDRHFLGLGYRLRVPLQYGFSTKVPVRLLSIVPTLEIPRFLDSDITLTFELLAELNRVDEQLDREELGVATSLTWPLTQRMSLSVGVKASMICFANPGGEACLRGGDAPPFQPQVRPSVRWRWDNQDNPLHPTRGFAMAAELRYILEIDRQGVAESRTARVNNFVKWQAQFEGALSPRFGPIIAYFIRYGGSTSAGGDTLLPPNERFTLGGSNGLRGFADHSVGRYDKHGVLERDITSVRELGGGNFVLNGSLELRIPVLRGAGIWLGSFLDGGALALRHKDLHAQSFRFSAGLGVRWLIGGQIPVRFDWGKAFGRRRCIEWRSDVALVDRGDEGTCASYERGQRFHFDLLYPF